MIFLSEPHISGRERELIDEVFAENQIMPLGKMTDRFERSFADIVESKYAVALSSGTAALTIAARLAGIGAGDRVYLPSFTFIGGVAPVVQQGATPVFFDCAPGSWCMDPDLVEEQLARDARQNQLPKAIIPADNYGHPCDLDRFEDLCARYGVTLIVDAAEGLGARYKDRPAGAGGLMSIHSFNGNKMITAGGGGCLTTDNETLARAALKLATQAREPSFHYLHTELGYNFRISNVLSAIGLAQLETLDQKVALRRKVFEQYRKRLEMFDGVGFMPEASHAQSSRWLTVIRVTIGENLDLKSALELFARNGVEARAVWFPMHRQPVFDGAEFVGPGLCDAILANGICLPSSPNLTASQQEHVCNIVEQLLRQLTGQNAAYG